MRRDNMLRTSFGSNEGQPITDDRLTEMSPLPFLPVWQPRSQGFSSLPPLVVRPIVRPRDAEKRDPGNEIARFVLGSLSLAHNGSASRTEGLIA